MPALTPYPVYRDALIALNHQIVKGGLSRGALMRAGRALRVARGNTFVLESDAEMNVVMDYAIYEYRLRGRTTIERYRERAPVLEPVQRELLDAMCSSRLSLFRLDRISRARHTLDLVDILEPGPPVRLTDIGFSQSTTRGLLLFTRLLPLERMHITAGMAFAFHGDLEPELMESYRALSKRLTATHESTRRLVAFFRLNRQLGIKLAFI